MRDIEGFRKERPDSELNLAKMVKWIMSQSPEPECTGRCFGCHNSLCSNSIYPYEELERIELEEIKDGKNK